MPTCEQCGQDYPDDSPGAICPACLLDGALSLDDDDPDLWLAIDTEDQPVVEAGERSGEVIGQWHLGERIGEGAFGEVYRATQSSPVVRIGALKIMKSGLGSPDAISRFEAERQALARLNHPNIATIFDAGQTEEGLPWYAMELINGEPITSYCRARDLPVTERLSIFQTVCEAVDYAHDNGIIHRDLKPSNIMVGESADGLPFVKVIDFGIAKAIDDPLTKKTLFTHAGVLIGTLEYMSPEQASGKSLDLDARSDVYSLGVLLYELLTQCTPVGRYEFREAAFDESLRMIRETEAERPSTVMRDPKLAAELDWITLKALEKNRERRYLNSGELSEDIQRFLNSEPVRARKTGVVYRTEKFIRRNRKSIVVAAVAVTLIMVSAVVGSWWSAKNRAVSPALLAASEFRPAPYPGRLDDSFPLEPSDAVDDTASVENFPATVAELCRTLRDDPDDAQARYRLWALLTLVNYPERVGDAIECKGKIIGVALVPNQKVALVASADGFLRAVSTLDGSMIQEIDFETPLTHLRASRSTKAMVAAAGENGTIFVIDFEDWQNPVRIETGTPIDALEVAASQDLIFCGDADGRLSAWPIEDPGSPRWSIDLGAAMTNIDYYSYGKNHRIACGLVDGRVLAIHPADGSDLGINFSGENEIVTTGLSWKSSQLIAIHRSGEEVVWDYRSGDVVRSKTIDGAPVLCATAYGKSSAAVVGLENGDAVVLGFSTDFRARIPTGAPVTAVDVGHNPDRIVATGNKKGEVRLWTFEIGSAVAEPIPFSLGSAIDHVDVFSDPKFLLAASAHRAQLWHYSDRTTPMTRFKESGYVTDAAVIPGTDIVRFMGTAGATDFHVHTAKLNGLPRPIPPDASMTALSGDGLWIAAAYGRKVRTWKIPVAGESIPGAEFSLDGKVTALALSADGALVAAGSETGSYQVKNSQADKQINDSQRAISLENSGTAAVTSAAVGAGFASFGHRDGTAKIVDLSTLTEISNALPPFSQAVDAMAISSAGTVAAGSRGGDIVLFSAAERRIIGDPLKHKAGVVSIDFSDDGHWLSSGTRDRFGHFWNAQDGRFVFHSHRLKGDVALTAFSPNGDLYFQCDTDNERGPTAQLFPPIDQPVPQEILDFAEAFGGLRIDDQGKFTKVPYAELVSVRKKIANLDEDGTRVRKWMRWTAAQISQRWKYELK